MSTNEILVIVIGLVAGWLVVSRVMGQVSGGSGRPPADPAKGEWHEILGVAPDADRREITEAYEAMRKAMVMDGQRAMTLDEQRKLQQQGAALEAAYRAGMAARARKR